MNNYYGIWLCFSSNNVLQDNTILNDWYGIRMDSSNNNTLQNNAVSNNDYGILLSNSSNNNITCNWVQDNTLHGVCLYGGSSSTNNISYNNIIENGNYNTTSGGWEWQFGNYQSDHVEAKHNYWGAGMNNSTIDASICDDEEGNGKVGFYPFESGLVTCAPISKPPTFTTADAVIALEIAVGSREYDPAMDINDDGQVSSVDALMILQAAAGG